MMECFYLCLVWRFYCGAGTARCRCSPNSPVRRSERIYLEFWIHCISFNLDDYFKLKYNRNRCTVARTIVRLGDYWRASFIIETQGKQQTPKHSMNQPDTECSGLQIDSLPNDSWVIAIKDCKLGSSSSWPSSPPWHGTNVSQGEMLPLINKLINFNN